MAYIGSTPTTQSFISGTDYFNGTGSQTSFTLSRSVGSVNDIEAVVNNVVQRPNDAYNVSGTSIVFTSAPSAGTSNIYVRYLSTTTQSITPSQNTVSYASWNSDLQSETWAFRNRIINGAMTIDQRNAGASVTNGGFTYYVDRWVGNSSQSSKYTAQQNGGSVTPPAGFTNYLGITSTSAYTVGSSETFGIQQRIEGLNCADLGWGTANAQTVTLSFWVRSSITGTQSGSFYNSDFSRGYAFTFTVNSANTWEQKTVTVTGDTSGTWLTTNGVGIIVNFNLGSGSTLSRTAGSWGAGCTAATGAVSVVGTNGATFYITGVQLEKGSTATSFDYRPYGTELALCQRYYEKSFNITTAPTSANAATVPPGLFTTSGSAGGLTTNYLDGAVQFTVSKRGNPTVTFFDAAGNSGKCERINPGILATANQPIGASQIGNASFQVASTSGTNAGRLSFYWMADSEL
jgi:hypothetical protein